MISTKLQGHRCRRVDLFSRLGGGIIGVRCEGVKRPSGGGCGRGIPPSHSREFFQILEYQNRILEHLKTIV